MNLVQIIINTQPTWTTHKLPLPTPAISVHNYNT